MEWIGGESLNPASSERLQSAPSVSSSSKDASWGSWFQSFLTEFAGMDVDDHVSPPPPQTAAASVRKRSPMEQCSGIMIHVFADAFMV